MVRTMESIINVILFWNLQFIGISCLSCRKFSGCSELSFAVICDGEYRTDSDKGSMTALKSPAMINMSHVGCLSMCLLSKGVVEFRCFRLVSCVCCGSVNTIQM